MQAFGEHVLVAHPNSAYVEVMAFIQTPGRDIVIGPWERFSVKRAVRRDRV
jgi:hypothetical protein